MIFFFKSFYLNDEQNFELKLETMGKGDRKSKRGKIAQGTYGVRRQKNKKGNDYNVAMNPPKEVKKPAAKTKKAVTKKKDSDQDKK